MKSDTIFTFLSSILLLKTTNSLTQPTSRRSVIQKGTATIAATFTFLDPQHVAAQAEDVLPTAGSKPKEFINVGTQAPPPDGESAFIELSNGVKVKDFRIGTGDEVVKGNSQNVMTQCTGRLLNLNGVIFYSTKNNNPDGFGAIPLTVNLGKGEVIPGLESGLVGMKKGGIRRLIIPANLAYSKYPELEPRPTNANDQRALDSVVKNTRRDATIMFDVQVERFR